MKPLKTIKNNQEGSAIFLTMVIILSVLVIMSGVIDMAYNQYEISLIQKKASNIYELAEVGIEKTVDTLNKVIASQTTEITNKVKEDIVKGFPKSQDVSAKLRYTYKNLIWHPIKDYIGVNPVVLANLWKIRTMEALNHYMNGTTKAFEYTYKTESDGTHKEEVTKVKAYARLSEEGQKILTDALDVKGDLNPAFLTQQEAIDCKQAYRVEATALSDQAGEAKSYGIRQSVTAQVDLLGGKEAIDNELLERYTWTANAPDILNSSVISFSDFVVSEGAEVTVKGDLSVKGSKMGEDKVLEPDQIGGVIAINGGQLTVTTPEENLNSNNTGSLYTTGNVIATNGWKENELAHYLNKTQITIGGNIVANTVGILDDFFVEDTNGTNLEDINEWNQNPWNEDKQGINLEIKVKQNIFVEDDVRIDKYIKGTAQTTAIDVTGMIIGIGDGKLNRPSDVNDPNKSSGVFNLSQVDGMGKSPQISAYGMWVHGQPYITFDEGGRYDKLYESIGEPYEGVYSLEEYRQSYSTVGEGTAKYLADPLYREEMQTDKIRIESLDSIQMGQKAPYVYAPAAISANQKVYVSSSMELEDIGVENVASANEQQTIIYEQQFNAKEAINFFYQGEWKNESNYKLSALMPTIKASDSASQTIDLKEKMKPFDYIVENPLSYYSGYSKDNIIGQLMTYKKMLEAESVSKDKIGFRGVHAFMTAARSVFYDQLQVSPLSQVIELKELRLSDILDIKQFTRTNKIWAPYSPIGTYGEELLDEDNDGIAEIDLSVYRDEKGQPIPSLIVINREEPVELVWKDTSAGEKRFKGIILSTGKIIIDTTDTPAESKEIILEGSVIVGGYTEQGKTIKSRQKMITGEHVGLQITGEKTKVTFSHNPNVLLEIRTIERDVVHQILDLFKLTGFHAEHKPEGSVSDKIVVNAKALTESSGESLEDKFKNEKYTIDRILLDQTSILEMEAPGTALQISTMKKVDGDELQITPEE